ncbi:kinesin-like protein KIN-14S, partial [Tanacetum coccineum]
TVVGNNLVNGQVTKSRLWLVDWAGSERAGKTGAEGDRLKEAKNINKSLTITQCNFWHRKHVTFLTGIRTSHVLQGSLGGDSKTLMFVQISPSRADLRETISSLRFARDTRVVERVPARKQTGRKQTSRVIICFKTRQKKKKQGYYVS